MTGAEKDKMALIPIAPGEAKNGIISASSYPPLPRIVVATTDGNGESAARRFLEFFTVNIRNLNTRRAYYRAACKFLDFAETRGVFDLKAVQPMLVAAWIETEGKIHEAQTVKQELAAVRMLFDWFVIGQMMPMNPASAVRGPKYSYRKGKTPVLSREDAKHLLGSIPLI